jgi:hypothetical protein
LRISYALAIEDANTLILGVENRDELEQCLQAEAAGPLETAMIEVNDRLGPRVHT